MLTAISVGRQCGMIPPADPVILIHAIGPESGKTARMSFEKANCPAEVQEEEEEGAQPVRTYYVLGQMILKLQNSIGNV